MPATDWKEVIPADEPAQLERFAAIIGAIQAKSAVNAKLSRGLHAKGNLGLVGELEVLADIPAEAKQGMFATPRTYPALVRYSNGSPRTQPDKKPDVRGIAIKVIGVDGKKTIPGLEDAVTQDFLAIRSPSAPTRDAQEFIHLVQAAQSPALLPFKLIRRLGVRRALQIIKGALAGFKLPTAPLAATTYYTVLPSQLGPYAVTYVLRPHDALSVSSKDVLGEEMAARVKTGPVVYDLCVRFFVDQATTPIEDSSVEWKVPIVPVARLTLAAQDTHSARGEKIAETIEGMSFDPWHARADMRPLGNVMRARNAAYRVSTMARKAAAEPTAMPSFD
ncbi:MAG TPA: hypothetical protein VGM39_20080 [Kofleriaceae bacterium]|jgi:hypothetical protein